MNKIFKVIWNHATQSWVAVSELNKAKGKTKSSSVNKISLLSVSLITAGATLIGGSAMAAVVDNAGTGSTSVQGGTSASASGASSVALGWGAKSPGLQAIAIGNEPNASGERAIAMSFKAQAQGANSIAIGNSSIATTDRSIAIGHNATVAPDPTADDGKGSGGIAIGGDSYAQGQGSIAIGLGNRAVGTHAGGRDSSVAIGEGNLAEKASFAFGRHNKATGDVSTAFGVNSTASGQQSVAFGTNTNVSGNFSYGMGSFSVVQSNFSTVVGYQTKALGVGSRDSAVFGAYAISNNSGYATVIGPSANVTDSKEGTALGAKTTVTNNSEQSTALGFNSSITNASKSIAAGSGTVISDATEGTVIGARSKITAGDKGIAVGVDNTITGMRSGAVGTNNTVSGTDSYVMGNNVTLATSGSVVLGNNSAQSSATTVTSGTVNGVTYGGFVGAPKGTGSYVSVGSSTTDSRQIKYVAAGEISATSTDAINGSQLHSVLTNGKWKVGNNTGAVVNNVAFGDQVNFIGANGTTVTTIANGNITNVTISSTQYVAGGNITFTNNPNGTVTISSTGGSSGASPENYFHVNDGKNSSDGNANTNKGAVDAKGGATGGNALAAGIQAKASGLNSVAIGINSNATMSSALAVGTQAKALGDRSSAFGILANASGGNSLALGDSANASGTQSVAIGMRSNSSGTSTVAIGSETRALACSTVAIGDQAKATDKFATAIGHYTNATAENAIAMGYETFATGKSSIALGDHSNATAAGSVALGNASNATASGSIALGNNTRVTVENGVALGSSSLADRAKFKATSATNTSSYSSNTVYALSSASDADKTAIVATATNTLGAVSVGNGTHTRQIINVAAGSNDSDAVNVAQLKAVANKIPNYVAGNNIQISEPDENGDITISATGGSYRWNLQANGINGNRAINNNNTVLFENGTGTTVVGSAGNTSKLRYNVNQETITVNDSTGAITSPTSGNNITFATAREVANAIATSGFKLDVNTFDTERDNVERSGNTIINPGDVVKVTAAGLSTIEYMESANGGGFRIITNKTEIQANNNGTAGLKSDADGNTGDEGNAVTAGDVINAINGSGWNTNASGNLATGTSARNTLINPGEAVNFAAGEGLTVEQIRSGNNITYRFNSTVSISNTNGSVNNNGSVSVGNGTQYLNATEVAKLVNDSFHTVNTTKITDQLESSKANASGAQVKAGDTLNFVAAKNLEIKQDGHNITYGLAKDIEVGNITATNITVGNVSIGGDSITVGNTTINNGTITNLTNNLPNTYNTDEYNTNNSPVTTNQSLPSNLTITNAATVGDILNSGWNLQENGAARDFVKPYDTVNFNNGTATEAVVTTTKDGKVSNITFNVKVDNSTISVDENGNLVANASNIVHGDNITTTVNNGTVSVITGNSNVNTTGVAQPNSTTTYTDADGNTLTKNDNGTYTKADGTEVAEADVITTTTSDADKVATVGDIVNTINDVFHTVNTTKITDQLESSKANASGAQVKAGDTLNFVAAKNLEIKQDGHNITYGLAKDIEVGNITATNITVGNVSIGGDSITVGNTTINNGTITNLTNNLPNTYNTDEYNTNNSPVTTNQSLPSNLTITNAATVGDILNSGWNLQENGAARDFVKPYDTVNFNNGTATEAVVTTTKDGKVSNITFNVKVDNSTISVDENGNLVANASNIVHGDNITTTVNNGTVSVITGNSNVNTTGVAQPNSTTTYTDADGNTLTKNDNGTYTKADGTEVAEADVITTTTSDADKVATVGDIVNTINDVFHTVNTTKITDQLESSKANASGAQVKAGDTLNFVAAKNLEIKQDGHNITYGLAKDIEVGNITATNITVGNVSIGGDSITVGNTTINNGTITNLTNNLPNTYNTDEYNTNNSPVTTNQSLPSNLTITNAATVGDILNSGWNLQENGAARDFVKPYDTVNFNNGTATEAVVTTTKDGKVSNITFNVKVDNSTISVDENGNLVANASNIVHGDNITTTVNNGTVSVITGNSNVNTTGVAQPNSTTTYTDADGNTLTKNDNGTYTKADGTEVAEADVITTTTSDADKVATVGDIVNTINDVFHTVNTTKITDQLESSKANASGAQVKAGDTLNFVAAKNLEIKQDGHNITYGLAKDIEVGNITATNITVGNVSIGGDSITVGNTTINNGTITNLTNNLPNTYNTDEYNTNNSPVTTNQSLPSNLTITNAATVGDILNSGWNLQENGAARDFVKPYDTVNFNNGTATEAVVTTTKDGKVSNITFNVKVDNSTISVDENGNLVANASNIVHGDNITTTVNNGTVSVITGNSNVNTTGVAQPNSTTTYTDADGNTLTKNDNGTYTKADGTEVAEADVITTTTSDADKVATVGDIVNTINDVFHTVNTTKITDQLESSKANASGAQVKAGDTLNFVAAKNLEIKQDGHNITYGLAKDIEVGNITATNITVGNVSIGGDSITVGNTTINNGTITNLTNNLPNTYNTDEYNTNNSPVTTNQSLPSNLTITNAATVGDILNSGWNLQENGAARDFVKPYDTVNFNNGTATEAVVTTTKDGKVSNITFNVKVDNSTISVDENGNLVANASNIVHGDNITTTVNNGTVSVITGNSNVNTTGVAQPNSTTTYTDADGNTLTKNDNGTYTKADGTEVAEADVITTTTSDADKVATVGDIVNTINDVFHTVNTTKITDQLESSKANASGAQVKAGDTLNFVAAKNLEIKQDGHNITYGLAKDIEVGNITATNITVGNVSIGGDSITVGNTTINNGTITNLTNNLPNTYNTDEYNTNNSPVTTNQSLPSNLTITNAATVGDILNSGWNLQENGAARDFVKPYDTVNFNNGTATEAVVTTTKDGKVSNITFNVKVDNSTISVDENGNLVANASNIVHGDNITTTVNNGTVSVITGNSNVNTTGVAQPNSTTTYTDADGNTLTKNDNGTYTKADGTEVAEADVITTTTSDADKVATVGDIVNTINDVFHTVNTTKITDQLESSKANASGAQVKAGDTLNFVAAKNLEIKQDGHNITYGLAKDIEVGNITATNITVGNVSIGGDSITVGNTTINNGTITNLTNNLPNTYNTDEYNTNNSPVTTNQSLPSNLTITNAATVGDILNSGWNLQENGAARDFVKPYDTVNFNNGTATEAVVTTTKDGKVSNITFNVKVDNSTISVDENGNLVANASNIVHGDNITTTVNNGTVSVITGNSNVNTTGVAQPNSTTTYTDADGNTLTKNDNGTYTKADGTEVAEADVITTTTSDADKVATVGDIVNTINDVFHTVNTTKITDQLESSKANASGAQVKAGDTLNFVAAKNLEIKQDGHNITYGLAKDIEVGNITATNITVGNVSIGGDSITVGNTTINNGTITNLTNNLPNTYNTDEYNTNNSPVTTNQSLPSNLTITNAATVGDILNSGWNLQENGAARDFVKPYDTVNFNNGTATEAVVTTTKDGKVSNITFNVKVDNSTISVDENGNLVANASNIVHGDNITTTVNNGTVSVITGNSNVNTTGVAQPNSTTTYTDADGNTLTKNDNGTYTKADGTEVAEADVITTTTSDADKVATVGDIVNTINDVFHTVNTTKITDQLESSKANASGAQVKAGDTLNFVAAKNLEIKQDGHNITYGLAKDIEVGNITATNITVGNVSIGGDSITVGNTTITNGTISGLNDHLKAPEKVEGGNVTNATQTAPVDLTNEQKQEAATVNDVLNAGWNLKANGDAVDAVTHGNNVDFTSNDGSVTINATTDGSTSKLDFKVNATAVINQVTGNISANSTGQAVADTTNGTVATVTDVADTINKSGWITNGKDASGNATSTIVNPGDTVNYVNGNGTTANVTITKGKNGQPDTVNVSYDVKAADDTITVDNNGVKVNTGDSKVENGRAAPNTTGDANKVATVGDIVNTINNVYHTVNATNSDEVVVATNGTTQVNAGDTLEFVAGKNLVVNQTGDRIAFGLSKDIEVNSTKTVTLTVGQPDTVITNPDGSTTVIVNPKVEFNAEEAKPATNNNASNPPSYALNITTGGKPTQITGVGSTLNTTDIVTNPNNPNITAGDKLVNLTNLPEETLNSAVTVHDITNMGWIVSATENGYVDTVKNANKVDFKGNGVSVTGHTDDNGVRTITVSAKVDNTTTKIVNNNLTVATGSLGNNPDGTVNFNTNGGTIATVSDVANAVNNAGWDLDSLKVEGTNGEVINDPTPARVNPGSKVNINAGKNIAITRSGKDVAIATVDNPVFNTVQVGGNTGPVISGDANGDVKIAKADGSAAKITNVAPGTADTDAVNVSQLKGAVGNINNRINKVDKDLRAGIAGSNAAAGLPQVYIPGKSMVAAAAGTYKGQSAVAVGYSRASDNGKLILKLQGNTNTRGDLGGSVGVGYQW